MRSWMPQAAHLVLAVVIGYALSGASEAARLRVPRFHPPSIPSHLLHSTLRRDLLDRCVERYRDAVLDHFTFAQGPPKTFKQRYYVCAGHWKPDDEGNPGPIFLYLGNEADVLLYLNNTGLMWESAPDFRAMLVFAEHRYYGKSSPFPAKELRNHMEYLSAEQAMADYAELVWELKHEFNATSSAVIGFGGSYGGMLASWMRMKYPHVLDGAVAGSAPIWNFMGEDPEFDPNAFAKGVTYDATPAAGSSKYCVDNVRKGWQLLQDLAKTKEGRNTISTGVGLCDGVPLKDSNDVIELRDWLSGAWDYMAMGNFPYESGYIVNGQGVLPPFPVRVACQQLNIPDPTPLELLRGMGRAAGVFYNHTGDVGCFDFRAGVNPETDETEDMWGYQYCTEMFMPFGRDGVTDMFWPEPWDAEATARGCVQQWGVQPRKLWATVEWGGRKVSAASNIVFTNGLLDPWHGGGVLRDVSDSLLAIIIPEGAHHLDLMFSNDGDPRSVIAARREQRALMRAWIADAATLAKARQRAQRQPVNAGLPVENAGMWNGHREAEGNAQQPRVVVRVPGSRGWGSAEQAESA